jgi:ankyrin repeat protein
VFGLLPIGPTQRVNDDSTDRAIAATATGDVASLAKLLDKGVSVSTTTGGGESFLTVAISQGHTEVVRLLLSRGADARATASDHYTPLESAVCRSNTDITGLLIDHGAGPDDAQRGRRSMSAQHYYLSRISMERCCKTATSIRDFASAAFRHWIRLIRRRFRFEPRAAGRPSHAARFSYRSRDI